MRRYCSSELNCWQFGEVGQRGIAGRDGVVVGVQVGSDGTVEAVRAVEISGRIAADGGPDEADAELHGVDALHDRSVVLNLVAVAGAEGVAYTGAAIAEGTRDRNGGDRVVAGRVGGGVSQEAETGFVDNLGAEDRGLGDVGAHFVGLGFICARGQRGGAQPGVRLRWKIHPVSGKPACSCR